MVGSQSIADIGGYDVGVPVADTIQATHALIRIRTLRFGEMN
jgi:hypothetical protein